MHDTAHAIGGLFLKHYAKVASTIVELGSKDINGSLRDSCPETAAYIGLDMEPGLGVDIVIKPNAPLPLASDSIDVVLASSMLEHDAYFWETFLELVRIVKPNGTLYINVPSNGHYHRYPVDNWRFYPDSGKALEGWARRNGYELTLVESFIAERKLDFWNDFVAVFVKGTASETACNLLLSALIPCTNVWRFDARQPLSERESSEDMVLIKRLRARVRELELQQSPRAPWPAGRLARLLQWFTGGGGRNRVVGGLIPPVATEFPKIAAKLSDPDENLDGLSEEIRRLLDLYVTSWPFAEDHYLQTYPEIAEAVRTDKLGSGWDHFRQIGYLEGRLPIKPAVDTDWYLKKYPDVAAAIQKDSSMTAEKHFKAHGYREGRLPAEPQADKH